MSGGRAWTTFEVRRLHEMRAVRMPTKAIAHELNRTVDAIYSFLRYVPANNGQPAGLKPIDRLPRKPRPQGKRNDYWTHDEIYKLKELAEEGASIREASQILGRSVSATRSKASELKFRFWSTQRPEHETTYYQRDAVEGSARLLQAMLALAA